MAHFAKVVNGIVEEVIVADQSFIDSGVVGEPSLWIQTSYNTRRGIHYGQDGLPDGGVALRYNYAIVGGHYDATADAFYAPMPWTTDPDNPTHYLDTTDYIWKLKPEFANLKPEVPVGGIDYWAWVEEKRQWLWDETLEGHPI